MGTRTHEEENAMSTALTRISDVTSRPLVSVEDLRRTFESLSGQANVVSPIAAVNHVKPLHQISLRMVVVEPDTECYQDKRFCKDNEFALGGVALQKLAAAAGAQVVSRTRLDDRSSPHYCEIEITLAVQDFDGAWRQMIGTKELDLRDGSEDAKTMLPKELSNARKHIQSLCETKAIYRALRKLFSLRQKYTKAELARPWVVPKLVPNLDLNDPDQKRAAIAEATAGTRGLFGPPPGEARTMRDVTPPPALPSGDTVTERQDAAATREAAETAAERDDQGDLDLLDVTETPKDAIPVIHCGCPCSCAAEVSPEVAEATKEKYGSVRCRACAPSRAFDFGRHRDLRGGLLGLPKHPNLTVEELKRQLDALAAKAPAAGARR
jgi:hypothetical protein